MATRVCLSLLLILLGCTIAGTSRIHRGYDQIRGESGPVKAITLPISVDLEKAPAIEVPENEQRNATRLEVLEGKRQNIIDKLKRLVQVARLADPKVVVKVVAAKKRLIALDRKIASIKKRKGIVDESTTGEGEVDFTNPESVSAYLQAQRETAQSGTWGI